MSTCRYEGLQTWSDPLSGLSPAPSRCGSLLAADVYFMSYYSGDYYSGGYYSAAGSAGASGGPANGGVPIGAPAAANAPGVAAGQLLEPKTLGEALEQIAHLKERNAALTAEVQELRASRAAAPSATPAYVPPPQFYPPPPAASSYPPPHNPYSNPYAAAYPGYSPYPPAPGYGAAPSAPAPGYGAAPSGKPSRPSLALNADNRRGPKGANLALFCIPNSYGDEEVLELTRPYAMPIFCSVARHRDSGASRGYAFISFESVAEADTVLSSLHNQIVEGRALRCELVRADKEGGGSKPY
jgi:hypothetical protein